MSRARGLVPWLVLASAAAWRFGGDAPGFAGSALTLLVALFAGRGAPPSPALQCLLAVIGASLAALGLNEAWWPCELGCSAGEDYATLFGWSVPALASASLLLLALLALGARRGGGRCRLVRAGAWLLAGVSAYYCGLSVHLDMVCGHCLAVHTAVFSGALIAWHGAAVATGGVLLAAVAAGATHLLYDAQPSALPAADPGGRARDVTAPPAPAPAATSRATGTVTSPTPAEPDVSPPTGGHPLERLSAADRALADRIDRVRRIGSDAAPLVIEFVHAFTCSHCAEAHEPFLRVFSKLTEDGSVQLVLRHSVSVRNQDAVELTRLAFAAAATGGYEDFVRKAFATQKAPIKPGERVRGSRTGRLLRLLGESMDLAPLQAEVAAHPAVYDALVATDADVVHDLEAGGELPRVFLMDRDGKVLLAPDGGHEFRPQVLRSAVLERLGR